MFEIDFMETISSSDEDRYHAFKNYLINKVSAKTKKTGIKKANIAKECDLAKNDFDKKRYSNLKSDKLSKIVRTYQFSIAETVDLYYRLGRCLNINNKFDKSIIGDQKIPENLCDRIGNELFIDCLFDLIKKEHVHSLCKKEKTEKIIELINFGKKEEAYSLFIKMLRQDGEQRQMYIGLGKSKPDTLHMRETLFEIGYFCGFSLDEIKRLYMSQGYSFAPEYIVFDAFAYNIMKYEETGHYCSLYKAVFSNIHVKPVNFDRTSPNIDAMTFEFSRRYAFRGKTKELESENEYD